MKLIKETQKYFDKVFGKQAKEEVVEVSVPPKRVLKRTSHPGLRMLRAVPDWSTLTAVLPTPREPAGGERHDQIQRRQKRRRRLRHGRSHLVPS